MNQSLKFKATSPDGFSRTVKSRVSDYFRINNKSTYANRAMILKALVIIVLWLGSYGLLISDTVPVAYTFPLWGFLGISIALVTINVGHDALHGAFSKKKWVNDLLGHTFNLNGASGYMWKNMHNKAHHTYTNIHGYDEDISPVSIIRLSPGAKLKKIHRYQHLYAFFLYCLAVISWYFMKDYVKFFKNEVGNYTQRKHPPKEYFFLFFYKAISYSIYLVIPFLLIEQSWFIILSGIVIMLFTSGFYLSIVFMLAHAVEETRFLQAPITGVLENDWYIHQLYTTANFSAGNRLAAFLTGGLNQQIEHHLFPAICTIHYPAIAGIVKTTAAEFGIPYYNSSFWAALRSHFRLLKKRGVPDLNEEKEVIRMS